jgi:CMP-N-acetylneuraminic acid synthetase
VRAVVVIPARGASKGIPRKNVKPFLGRPLLAWTVETALETGVGPVVVSTEDDEVAEVARAAGAEVVRRPVELAGDEVPTAPAVRHAVESLDEAPRFVLVLEPTAPARQPLHVRGALELLESSGADSVATISEVPYHHVAEKQLRVGPDGSLAALDGRPVAAMTHRRQEVEPVYAFNGLVWGCRAEVLAGDTLWGERVVGYIVDPRYAIDLDRPEDWEPAEARVRELLDG